jgi:digeranylgeranylglycerophospholipid reductase
VAVECDVLVVGAGPGGSSAARAAAAAGARTILIERKREVGVPVQCGEGVGAYLFPFLPFKIPQEQLVWELNEVAFWANGVTTARAGKLWTTYMLNRDAFDAWLARCAGSAGAKIQTSTALIGLELKDDFTVTKATVSTPAGEAEIKPRVVVAADGVDSTVLKLLGFTVDKKTTCGKVVSFELKNLPLSKQRSFQVFLGDFAPGVYAYILPKSATTANVGTGTIDPRRRVKRCYEEFLELPPVEEQLRDGVVVREKSGWAPIRYFTEQWVYGNVLLVGDAANQNFKPFVEGIIPTIICGDLAGKTAVEYLQGRAALSSYAARIQRKLGVFFSDSDRLIPLLYESSKSTDQVGHLLRLCLFANLISLKQFERWKRADSTELEKLVERWNRSKLRQPVANLSELLGFLYLKLTQPR